jgi:hypothetical protein
MARFSKGPPMPSPLVCVASSALIDPTSVLHECLQLHVRGLAFRSITQRSGPFADHFVVRGVPTRAANDGSKWISVIVKSQISKLKRVPQQPFGSSSHFEMHNDREYSLQIAVHGVASNDYLENPATQLERSRAIGSVELSVARRSFCECVGLQLLGPVWGAARPGPSAAVQCGRRIC